MKFLLPDVVLRVAFLHAAVLLLVSPRTTGAETIDPVVLKERATKVMETYCVSCHGPDKQKGKVRLDALETIDPVDLQKLLGTTKEVVHFEEMPPEEEKQPSKAERQVLMQWLDSQLTGFIGCLAGAGYFATHPGFVVAGAALVLADIDEPAGDLVK